MSEPDKPKTVAEHLRDAINSLSECVGRVPDADSKELLYHAGMTIRTLQQKLDPSERKPD